MIGDGGEYQTVGGGARNISRLLFLISCLPFLLAFPASPCTSKTWRLIMRSGRLPQRQHRILVWQVRMTPRFWVGQSIRENKNKCLIRDSAKLGYKQELRRNFTMIEVFGIAFSIMGLLPSIASTLAYSIPAGPVGMVWVSEVKAVLSREPNIDICKGWFLASGFIFVVGLAMARFPHSIQCR